MFVLSNGKNVLLTQQCSLLNLLSGIPSTMSTQLSSYLQLPIRHVFEFVQGCLILAALMVVNQNRTHSPMSFNMTESTCANFRLGEF